MKDYYRILGVSQRATTEEITRVFRNLAKAQHPDVDRTPGANERFCAMFEAYDMLRYPDRRAVYDQAFQAFSQDAYPSDPERPPMPPEPESKVREWARESAIRARQYANMSYREFAGLALLDVTHYGRLGCIIYVYFGVAVILVLIGVKALSKNPLGLALVGAGVFLAAQGIKKLKRERQMHQYERLIQLGSPVYCPQCGTEVKVRSKDAFGLKCSQCNWMITLE